MHKFTASGLDKTACVTCKRPLRDHTAIAQCEVCGKVGSCELYGSILFCAKCYSDEMTALAASKLEAENRVIDSRNATLQAQAAIQPMSPESLLSKSQKIDSSIVMSQDIYNAKTVELTALIKAINEDVAIENKPYARAKVTYDRIEVFQHAIFDAEQALLEAKIGLRQSKEYLNQIISDVAEAEREQFRVKDISYPAKPPKTPKVKSLSPGKPKGTKSTFKADLAECAKFAKYLSVSQDAIHALSVQHHIPAKNAAKLLAGMMDLTWNNDWN